MYAQRFSFAVIAAIGLILCSDAGSQGEEIALEERANGLVSKLERTLENLFPPMGREIAGTKFELSRKVSIKHIGVDTDSGTVAIVASVRYYTSDAAVINQLGLGISVTTNFDTKYNIETNDLTKLKVSFELPRGWGSVDCNLGAIKKVLDGDLAAAFELIPNGGVVKRKGTSEYDSQKKWYQDKYGKENVYFASSDFVRWASPETAGEWIIGLVASGGTSASAISAEIQNEVRKEFTHIVKWLTRWAQSQATAIANDFVSGKQIQVPELKLIWQRVTYRSTVIVASRSLPEVAVDHAAFVLIWKQSNSGGVSHNPSTAVMADDIEPKPKWKLGARYAVGPSGCRVVFLTAGGAAGKAGLQLDDLLTSADGKSLKSAPNAGDPLIQVLKQSSDSSLEVEVITTGNTRSVSIELEPRL